MGRSFWYIVGQDCCVRKKTGKTVTNDIFDGPHPDEATAWELGKSMVASGDFKVIESQFGSRDSARQAYNHDLSLQPGMGAAAAVQNKYKLQPKSQVQIEKAENDAAWGR